MRPLVLVSLVSLAASLVAVASDVDPFTGRFRAGSAGQEYTLALARSTDERYEGTLSLGQQRIPLSGWRRGDEIVGNLDADGDAYQFVISLRDGGALFFEGEDGDAVLFRPARGGPGGHMAEVSPGSTTSKPVSADDDWPVTTEYPSAGGAAPESGEAPRQSTNVEESAVANTHRQPQAGAPARPAAVVVINGRELSQSEVGRLQQGGIQVQPGQYWYDPMCGAWGYAGGPTLGFLQAGIDVGAALPSNASNGYTGVIVNGRQLPVQDLLALQSVTGPLQPGRYFIDQYFNAGIEGGPPLINLRQASAQRGQSGGSSWSSSVTGNSGGSDGQGSGFVIMKDAGGNTSMVGYGPP